MAKQDFENDNKTKILVHCCAGISRSAAIVIAYCMHCYKWNLEKSYSHVKKQRSIINPNVGFWCQLSRFEQKLYNNEVSSIGLKNRLLWLEELLRGIKFKLEALGRLQNGVIDKETKTKVKQKIFQYRKQILDHLMELSMIKTFDQKNEWIEKMKEMVKICSALHSKF